MGTTCVKMLSVVTLLLVVTQSCTKQIENAEDVIKQMHAAYEGKWYKNMTFRQETSFYAGDSLQRQQTWYEAAKIGEGLVIKFDSINSGNGYIFKKDSMYIYNNDKLVNSAPRVHDILELGFNIYRQKPNTTIQKLKKYDFPGNIKELDHILSKAAVNCQNQLIREEDIDLSGTGYKPSITKEHNLDQYIEEIEVREITNALAKTKNNKTKAAELLGISFRALRYKIKKLEIDKSEE